MDELAERLVSIENKLGGSQEAPETDDKLGWHLSYIESLIGGGSSDAVEDVKVNDTSVVEDKVANINLKTINNESITGEGNIAIPSGSEVTANPTLEGDEGSLTGLEVDGTKYKVGGSSEQKYLHTITLQNQTNNLRITMQYIDNVNKVYTTTHLQEMGDHLYRDLDANNLFKDCMFEVTCIPFYNNGTLLVPYVNRGDAVFDAMAMDGQSHWSRFKFKQVWVTRNLINLSDGTATTDSIQGSSLQFILLCDSCIPL